MAPTLFPNTPSGGRDEARAALARANARRGRFRPLRAIQGFLPIRRRGAVQAVLDTLVAEGDADSAGGAYTLTDQGLETFRHHPNPRFGAWPVELNT